MASGAERDAWEELDPAWFDGTDDPETGAAIQAALDDDEPAASSAPADAPIRKHYDPVQRLVVIGSDPFALAIGGMGRTVGWEVRLLSPFGPSDHAPFDLACDRRALDEALDDIDLDRWTAVAVATHDLDLDERALIPALQSDAGYVGVLGSRRKLAERFQRLAAAGLTQAQIDRLRAPIGLAIPARSPWEVAISVVAEVIASRGD